ncbi:hypothetical protein BDV93DRAFT_447343 [Ceratobasidium sp. AG-I]|nr:hypothetical protein BDV93DRAFT_447343 [Ceratobasidium sp. AG-I]
MILPRSFVCARLGLVLCTVVGVVWAGRVRRDGNVKLPRRTETRAGANAPANLWTIDTFYEGQSFFEGFNFFTYDDTTGGQVTYVDSQTATSEGLAYVTPEGQAVMRVDNTTVLSSGQPRKSVRIESYKRYNGGLFILDIAKAPYGCSVWPAFWTVGPNWPWSGEIDVFEGVNQNTRNQVTFHTDAGCTITNPQNFTGELVDSNCDVTGNSGNAGCGLINDSAASFGAPFNAVGGGVFASRWDSSGIYVWFFHRSTIPHDITQNTPNPDNWGEPTALLSNTSCPPQAHFWDHQIVLNIDICGFWAGNAYSDPQSPAGACPGTCSDQVMDPTNFDVSPNNLG